MDVSAVISAVCAVLSVLGAGFAWWWERFSRIAQAEAKAARKRAKRDRKRAEEHLRSIERLADYVRGPRIIAKPRGEDEVVFQNRTEETLVGLRLLNGTDLFGRGLPEQFDLRPFELVNCMALESLSTSLPACAHFSDAEGREYFVELPHRS